MNREELDKKLRLKKKKLRKKKHLVLTTQSFTLQETHVEKDVQQD